MARKLGVLLSVGPGRRGFDHALEISQAAAHAGVEVYLYFFDDAVSGLSDPRTAVLRSAGVRLFACAFSARVRRVVLGDQAVFSGLAQLSELIASTDRFLSFNH